MQGTVEHLLFPDAAFDTVLSIFGVMFAARPDRVLSELARVKRPGGRVVLVSWTPVHAFESLDEDRRAELAADLTAHWSRHRRSEVAGTEVAAECLEVVAVRR